MGTLVDVSYDFLDYLMYNPKKDFLSGKHLLDEELELIISKLDYGFYDTNSYMQDVNYIKEVLLSSKILYKREIIFIKTNKDLTEEDIAVLIRYVNVCRKNKYIIVLNNKLIYTPFNYHKYDEKSVRLYIDSVLKEYNIRRKSKIIKYKLKKYIKNLMTKA